MKVCYGAGSAYSLGDRDNNWCAPASPWNDKWLIQFWAQNEDPWRWWK